MNFVKSFSAYTIAGFLGAAINFMIMPFLSHYLSPSDYGVLSLFNAYVTLTIPLIGLAAAELISVEYFKKEDNTAFASLFSTIQVIPIIPFLLFITVFYLFQEELSALLEFPDDTGFLYLIPVIALLIFYVDGFMYLLIIRKKANQFTFVQIIKIFIEVSLTIILVVLYDMGWQGRILSWLATSILFFVGSFVYFYKLNLLTLNIRFPHIKSAISFGAPLIMHIIGMFVVNQSDRIFIAKMVSVAETGIYNIGYQIGSMVLIFSNVFYKIYTPYLYERLSHLTEEKNFQIVRFGYLFTISLLVILSLVVAITPSLFSFLINENFASGQKYVIWVALSYVFWGMSMIFFGFINYYKKTLYLGALSFVNVVMNIVLNYFFIKSYGGIGAAYATCISFFIILICAFIVTQRLYPMPWFQVKKVWVSFKQGLVS